MKYTKVAATTRVDFALEDAPATAVPFDVNNTEFVPDFCVVNISLHDTDGPQVMTVALSGPRILPRLGTPGRATEHYMWRLDAWRSALPPHVQELADAALSVYYSNGLEPGEVSAPETNGLTGTVESE